jgi:hypothetical protein
MSCHGCTCRSSDLGTAHAIGVGASSRSKGKKYKFELAIVNDEAAKNIPAGGTLVLM